MADFDPLQPWHDLTGLNQDDDNHDAGLDHALRSTLQTMADQARYADLPAPAAQIRALGSRRRERRIIGSAALAGAVAVVAAAAVAAGMSGVSLHTHPVAPSMANPALPPLITTSGENLPNPMDDVGYLVAAQSVHGRLELTFDRVIWLTGAAATAANHGVKPPDDHLIVNNNTRLRTFTVQPRAALFGSFVLGPDQGSTATPISADQLIDRTLTEVGSAGKGVLVTLVHTGGADGPVTRLQEVPVP